MSGWLMIGRLADIPRQGSRVINTGRHDIAVFRTMTDEVFALRDKCPHKGGPLSQGIVHGQRVTCPLHNWVIELADGNAVAPDIGCTVRYPVRVEDGEVHLSLTREDNC